MPNQPLTRGEYQRLHKKDSRYFLFMLIAWLILVIGGFFQGYILWLQTEKNKTALKAVCTLKANLQIRVATAQKILRDPANTKRVYGIPREVVEQNLRNQERTLKALEGLDCSE